jgi:hypothetical protein
MTRDCKHGQLARSCEICELEREIAALVDDYDTLKRECVNKDEEIAALKAELQQAKYTDEMQGDIIDGLKADNERLRWLEGGGFDEEIESRTVREALKEVYAAFQESVEQGYTHVWNYRLQCAIENAQEALEPQP